MKSLKLFMVINILLTTIFLNLMVINVAKSEEYNINKFPEKYLGQSFERVTKDFGKPKDVVENGLNSLLIYENNKTQYLFMYRVKSNIVVGISINYLNLAKTNIVEFNQDEFETVLEYGNVFNLVFKNEQRMQVVGLIKKPNAELKEEKSLRDYVDKNFDLIGVKFIKAYNPKDGEVNASL